MNLGRLWAEVVGDLYTFHIGHLNLPAMDRSAAFDFLGTWQHVSGLLYVFVYACHVGLRFAPWHRKSVIFRHLVHHICKQIDHFLRGRKRIGTSYGNVQPQQAFTGTFGLHFSR